MAVDHGLGLVVVDGPDDVDRLEATVPDGRQQAVLVRVIPGVTADTHAHVLTGHAGSKFGLAPADAAALIRRIEASPRLDMQGLHVHVGSQILDVAPFAQSVAPVAALGEFPVYDLGGGLGARYTYADDPPTVPEYLDALVGAARAISRPRRSGHRAWPQHGRLGSGDPLPGDHREAWHDHLRRGRRRDGRQPRGGALPPALRGGAGRPTARARRELVTVVGRHCESGDVLVDGVRLPDATVGDLLAVPATGAYCYDGQQLETADPVVFVKDGRASGRPP